MTLTPKNEDDFLREDIFYGKTIGPIPNRVKDAKIKICGKEIKLDKNEGRNTLHSGKDGLSRKYFTLIKKLENEHFYEITYSLTTKNYGGLGGKITYFISYAVYKNSPGLEINYHVVSSKNTYVSLTNHLFFTLGEKNLDNFKLHVDGDLILEPNKDDLTYGKDFVKAPQYLDFYTEFLRPIMDDINHPDLANSKAKGYDHLYNSNMVFVKTNNYALAVSGLNGYDCVQIYSDNYEDNVDVISTNEKIHRALAIEMMDNPLNREENNEYSRTILYMFEKID